MPMENKNKALDGNWRIYTSILMLLFTLGIVVAATFAWLLNNRNLDTEGMKFSSEVSPDLVIGLSKAELVNLLDESPSNLPNNAFLVSFDDPDPIEVLKASTHDWTIGTQTGLKYNTNPRVVSNTTGNKQDIDLTFAQVAESSTSDFYIDFTVYIASLEDELSIDALYAELEYDKDGSYPEWMNAASVDFYLNSAEESNYCGTLNIAKKSCEDGSRKDKCEITSMDIPVVENTAEFTPICVVMRMYVDGALQDSNSPSKAYIRTEAVDVSEIALCVVFTVKN